MSFGVFLGYVHPVEKAVIETVLQKANQGIVLDAAPRICGHRDCQVQW